MKKKGARSGDYTAAGRAYIDLTLETFRLNGRLLVAGDRLVKSLGLTSTRWQVMGAIVMSTTPLTVPYIARNMGLQRQSVQRTVDLLEKQGIVQFVENPHHRRAMLVVLTPKGEALYEQVHELSVEWANRMSQGLSATELQDAVAIMRKLRSRLGDRPAADTEAFAAAAKPAGRSRSRHV